MRDLAVSIIVLEIAERHRGDDPVRVFLLKQKRTLTDMLAGRPVRTWRLDRLREFMEDIADTTLRLCSRPPCGGSRL